VASRVVGVTSVHSAAALSADDCATPDPQLPESSVAALFPLGVAAVVGGWLMWSRRRRPAHAKAR
jgi:hypothetical protein